jgi:hypothetical protein
MMWMLTLVSLAFGGGDGVADAVAEAAQAPEVAQRGPDLFDRASLKASPERDLDYKATYASFAPQREHLRALLARDVWEAGPTGPAVADFADVLGIVEPVLDAGAPRFERADVALAAETNQVGGEGFWTADWARSHYKVERSATGDVVAVAFGVQRATSGRSLQLTSMDLMVTYEDGRPKQIFAAHTGPWGSYFSESLFTVTTDAEGRVVALDEVRLEGRQQGRGMKLVKGEANVAMELSETVAVSRRWTRA